MILKPLANSISGAGDKESVIYNWIRETMKYATFCLQARAYMFCSDNLLRYS